MAKIDAVKEDISLMSKLLMVLAGTTVVTVGGVAGLYISGQMSAQVGFVFAAGTATIIILVALLYGLFMRIRYLIRLLGDL